jgi:hypothetical protein
VIREIRYRQGESLDEKSWERAREVQSVDDAEGNSIEGEKKNLSNGAERQIRFPSPYFGLRSNDQI